VDQLVADVDVAGKAGKYVMYVLAVAGGFLIGNILTWVLCRLVARMAFKRKMNHQFERALRILGGIAVAALVAYLLFRFGSGWGLGGSGTGEGEGSGGLAPSITPQSPELPKTGPKKSPPAEVISATLRVRIEPATAYPRTFRIEASDEAVDLAAAKKALEEFRARVKGEPRLEIRVYQNSTAVDHADVREFIKHAHDLDFATRVEKVAERVP
jgi:hypothetical protein